MKKELILAKNIIRTPVLLEQTYKNLNFDDIEFYRHELVPKREEHEFVHPEIGKRKKSKSKDLLANK